MDHPSYLSYKIQLTIVYAPVKYLGQYTHGVAIINQRILNIANGQVTFTAKDYRDKVIKKPVTLSGIEFLRRFTMHILPKRFVKIRRFGIYNHTTRRNLALQFVDKPNPDIDALIKQKQPPETHVQRIERLTGVNPCLCPICKTGQMCCKSASTNTLSSLVSSQTIACKSLINPYPLHFYA